MLPRRESPGPSSVAQPRSAEHRDPASLTTRKARSSRSPKGAAPSGSGNAVIHVLVVGDQPIVRTGLRLLIEGHARTWAVDEAGNCPEDIGKIGKQPDVVVADPDSSQEHPVVWLSRLFERLGDLRMVVLASGYDQKLCRRLGRLGVMGVVPKSQSVDFLLKAIERVHAGEVWLERSTVAGLIRGMTGSEFGPALGTEAAKMATLTRREREIIECLGEGLDVSAIARQLFISEITVRHHLTSILEKLGLHDRFSLVFYAYRHGLSAPPR